MFEDCLSNKRKRKIRQQRRICTGPARHRSGAYRICTDLARTDLVERRSGAPGAPDDLVERKSGAPGAPDDLRLAQIRCAWRTADLMRQGANQVRLAHQLICASRRSGAGADQAPTGSVEIQ
ncbi:hypothetical protein Adt_18090 [Abeliophyllum distichum]|uniref:Uncharacterized protein n=1 Tax=Abeliophyllum distichum TaxID=126358 RepID=A0ABD1TID4_9LAMI